MASAAIGSVYAKLGLDTAEFVAGVKKAQGTLQTFGTGLKAFAGSAAVTALTNLGLAAVRAGAQIGDLAETIGVSAEQIQVYNRMAVASGTSAEVMAKGLQSIAEQSVEADSKLSRLFAANGITAKGMETNEVIRTFTDLLKNARNPTEQLAIATGVLGDRLGRELVEALREGSKGYDTAMQEMIASGTLMSNAEIKRLQDLETEYNKVADSIAAYWMKTVVAVSDAPSAFMDFREKVQKMIYGTTDAEIAAKNYDPLSSMKPPSASNPLPVQVTNMPAPAGKAPSAAKAAAAPSWLTGSSENPMQGGYTTGYDLRGNGLVIDEFTADLQQANSAAYDLAESITDSLGGAIAGLADGTMSFKDAFSSMAQSLIGDLADITSQLLRSGLMQLLGNLGTGFGGAQGLGGFGGFYAEGGTLGAGKWGIAGENGPEIVKGPASISPMGGGGTQVNIYNQGGGQVEQRKRRGANGQDVIDVYVRRVAREEQARGSKNLLGVGFGVPPALAQR